MGGRGSSSPGNAVRLSPTELAALPYNVISYDDGRGGAIYPFLEQTRRAWRILTWPVNAADVTEPHPAHTFGLDAPTLRWVNGEQVSDLYVDGMTTGDFLEAAGLEPDMGKGGFVLSKRLSRLMRPHFTSGFFDPGEVTVAYMTQTADEARVWDGAGLISRRMLLRLAAGATGEDPSPDDPDSTVQTGFATGLRRARRVEFTIMTGRGQDKGHAIVADDLRDENGRPVDFLLPRDTKREIRLRGDRTFVGLSVVHGHNDMRLDIQSLINLHPFFEETQLLDWLRQEGELFARSVESGSVAEVMGRIDGAATLESVRRWPLREYLASGGHPMWFRSHVKGLMNQHLRRLNQATLTKLRLPIPGGRHYIMPAAVGRRAGIRGLDVPRGHVHIDDRRATAWVNDEDWLALPDSPRGKGIAGILGGADNDDALWLHPFTDHDGARKVLAWRSPNQAGEYVVLRPTAGSHALPWARPDDEPLLYPPADSRRLPPRVDLTDPAYLGLVDTETAGGSGWGETYSVARMAAAVEQAVASRGALGMYCNALMLNKALYGRLPDDPPAPLEDIIDGAVKTGADLSRVVAWNYANSRAILERGTPIPSILHQRLSVDRSDETNPPPPPRGSGLAGAEAHWLDRLEAGVKSHIREMESRRDGLAERARPPQALFDHALSDPESLRLGAGLNRTYAAALRTGRKGEFSTVMERARQATEDYLTHFPPDRRRAILRGALANVYEAETPASDAAAWLAKMAVTDGPTEMGLGPLSVASLTIEALQEIGLLDELVPTKAGLIVYPVELREAD